MTTSFCAAFFKGTSPGLGAILDWAIHEQTDGIYSHVELVFSDGRSASSVGGAGVRFTTPGSINFDDATRWDLVDLTGLDETAAIAWFTANAGKGYDYWGDARFVVGLLRPDTKDDFCSEACADALGFIEGWRFDPNCFSVVIKRLMQQVQAQATPAVATTAATATA
jgi:hypothetical protein